MRSLNISRYGIVVGLDESRSARAALRWASDYARRTGLALRALHALSWPFGVRSPGLDIEAERPCPSTKSMRSAAPTLRRCSTRSTHGRIG